MRGLGAFLLTAVVAQTEPALTPIPQGPLRVEGNRLVDARGRTILLRGADIPGLEAVNPSSLDVETVARLDATTFSTMRQRWNMNAVRLPVSVAIDERDASYLPRVADIVRKANRAGLVAILAAGGTVDFWRRWAAHFKDSPMVIFCAYDDSRRKPDDWQQWLRATQALVDAIRSTGATQVIAVMGRGEAAFEGFTPDVYIRDRNIVYEVRPEYSTDLTDADRDRRFGFLAERFPVLASDWGLRRGENSAACHAIPAEPEEIEELVRHTLDYFEVRGVSWTAHAFQPGKLIIDYATYDPTEIDETWECAEPASQEQGMGEFVRYFLFDITEKSLVPVNAGSGSMVIPPDSIGIVYGHGLPEKAEAATSLPLPTTLAGVRLRIIDAAGVVYWAPLTYAAETNVNFIMPAEAAPGVASFTLVREDGDGPSGKAIVRDIAPGLLTVAQNARGPAHGTVYVVREDGEMRSSPISRCDGYDCETIPISLEGAVDARIVVPGTGFRRASSRERVTATIGDVAVPVLETGADAGFPGLDQITIGLTQELKGMGEADLIVTVEGEVANAVRVHVR